MFEEFIEKTFLLMQEKRERYAHSSMGFDLLGMAEVNQLEMLHSAIVADLLNPQGKHGQGVFFLKRFLYIAPLKGKVALDVSEYVSVVCEKFIGAKTDETGGRIDIYIKDKNGKEIIIENKIYAGDQENQLVRYHNFSHNATLVYLTLDGKQPSEYSCKNLTEDDYICLSYAQDIIGWLNGCSEEDSIKTNTPLYSGLKQYINTLNNMTSKPDSKMNKELIKYIMDDRSRIESALEISNALNEITNRVIREFWEKLFVKLHQRGIEFTPYYYDGDEEQKTEDFFLADNLSGKIVGVRINVASHEGCDYCFVIERETNLYYGFPVYKSSTTKTVSCPETYRKRLKEYLDDHNLNSSERLVWWKYVDNERINLKTLSSQKVYKESDSLAESIVNECVEYIKIVKAICE